MLIHFVVLLLLRAALCFACTQHCTFIWDNTTGNSTASSFTVPWNTVNGSTTNMVTIDGTFSLDLPTAGHVSTWIRFRKGVNSEPIALELIAFNGTAAVNEVHVQGSYNGQDTPSTKITNSLDYWLINIQISDATAATDKFYEVYTNTSSDMTECNFGNTTEWDRLYNNNVTLHYTERVVTNTTSPHLLNYISVCNTAQPAMCSSAVSSTPTLGQDLNLTCTGSGAPYLEVMWEPSSSSSALSTLHPSVYNTTLPDHTVTSTLTLNDFTLAHANQYRCTVSNMNFRLSSSQIFEVQYQEPYVITLLSDDTYTAGTNFTLSWVVSGWPLDTLHLSCNGNNISFTPSISTTTPTANYSVAYGVDVADDVIRCVFRNASVVVGVTRVYRVGTNCTADEYGWEKECRVCPWGTRSVAGAAKRQDCYNVTSNCTANYYLDPDNTTCVACPRRQVTPGGAVKVTDCSVGNSTCPANYYGTEDNCTACPHGKVSLPRTVKVDGCTSMRSACGIGTYGMARGACTTCEWGKTSLARSVKVEGCYNVRNACAAGNYSTAACSTCDVVCKECGTGYTSRPGAGKEQDCVEMESECEKNQYGYQQDCQSCPKGTISKAGSKTVADCVKDHMKKEVPFLIGVGVALLFIASLVIGTFLRFYVKHAGEKRDIKVVFSREEGTEGNTTVVVNEFADSAK